MAQATLNIRLPESLKEHGTQVLRRNGISVSDAVRGLYEFMEREQRVPDFLLDEQPDVYEQRRIALRVLAGCIDGSLSSVDDIKEARLKDKGLL